MRQTSRNRRTGRGEAAGFDAALEHARAGRSAGFTSLYRSVDRELLGFARARGASDPEGFVNATLLRAFRSLETFEGTERDFRSWVFAICRNLLIDESRRDSRRPVALTSIEDVVPLADPVDVASDVVERAGQDDILRLLGTLTEHQRDVVALRVLGDLSLREVSLLLDKPVGAVKSLQHRALTSLSREIRRVPVSSEDGPSLS